VDLANAGEQLISKPSRASCPLRDALVFWGVLSAESRSRANPEIGTAELGGATMSLAGRNGSGHCGDATMPRDSPVGLIEPMLAAREWILSRCGLPRKSHRTIDPQCLENPRPEGAESTLAESASSPFQAEPGHSPVIVNLSFGPKTTDLRPTRGTIRNFSDNPTSRALTAPGLKVETKKSISAR